MTATAVTQRTRPSSPPADTSVLPVSRLSAVLLTITAGFIHMNFWTFLWASLASRAFSFLLVGILFRLFGAPIKAFIDKYLIWVTGAFLVAVVAGFLAIGALSGDKGEQKVDKCSGATLESIGLDRK